MRGLALAFSSVLLAGLTSAAPPAEASHWCAQTTVRVNPPFVPTGNSQAFAISLDNSDVSDTQLTSVTVGFDWETNARSLGGGTLPTGGSLSFTVTPTALPSGTHTVTVTFTGTNDGDPPSQVTTCVAARTITAFTSGENSLGGIVTILVFVLGIVIVVAVVIVVVAVVLGRKKPGPTPPETPPPPYSPPQTPPPGPPTAPPPSYP